MRNKQGKSLLIDFRLKIQKQSTLTKKFWNYQTKQIIEFNDGLEPKAKKIIDNNWHRYTSYVFFFSLKLIKRIQLVGD